MHPLTCPHCNYALSYRPDLAGMTFACPQCNGPFSVPAPVAVAQFHSPQVASQEAFAVTSHQVRSPHSTVTVNVPRQHSNSLGTASMILGILGLFLCWMPFFGLPLAGLGLALGGFGILASLGRKGTGVGMAIGGTFVSGLVLLVAGAFWWSVFAATSKTLDDIRKDMAKQERQQKAAPVASARPRPILPPMIPTAEAEPPEMPEAVPTPSPTVPQVPKAWQASHRWRLTDGRTVEGSLKAWSRPRVVIVQPDGKEVITNIDGVSQADQDWVDAQLAK